MTETEKEMQPLKDGDQNDEAVNDMEFRDNRSKLKKCCMENLLMTLTLVGVVFGFAFGFIAREFNPSSTQILWLGMPGDLFIRLLKMTILPLIAANVVVVTASLDPKVNGKISVVALTYILSANIISAIIGLTCGLIIRPGKLGGSFSGDGPNVAKLTTSDVFADLLYNFFPDNIVGACVYKSQTLYKPVEKPIEINGTNMNITEMVDQRVSGTANAVNMIGIIFCSFLFGLAARSVGESGEPLLKFFKSLAEVVIQVMRWLLWLTPVGVCFMIAASVASVKDIVNTVQKLGLFIVTVCTGLTIHFFLMNIVLFIASRKNPFTLLPKTFRSWFISFATTSPIVAIPDMYECCDLHGISPAVSRFVIPFAAALKGDGSAVFITAASVFIAQLTDYPLNAGSVVVIGLLVASAMMALPNVPSASIVILVTILTSVGIPITPVGMLFAVEWILDRLRSGAIGMSHCYCAAFCHHFCLNDIKSNEVEQSDDNQLKNVKVLENGKSDEASV